MLLQYCCNIRAYFYIARQYCDNIQAIQCYMDMFIFQLLQRNYIVYRIVLA